MQSIPPPPATTPLWARLRALFERVIAAIGAPAFIAALTLAPGMRTGIVRQLALIELLARKLLLAEASALAPAATSRGPRLVEINLAASGLYTVPQTRRRTRARSSGRIIDPYNPETWSARFALAMPRDERAVQDRRAPRIRALWGDTITPPAPPEPAPRQHASEAFRIARRAEALRRMLNDPTRHVHRLARSRRFGVARTHDTITRYAFAVSRRFVGDHHDPRLTVDIFSAAVYAHTVLTDTS